MGFFEYKAELWINDKEETELGITYGDAYSAAMTNIENYYGEDLVRVALYALEPISIYVLDGPGREEFFDGKD